MSVRHLQYERDWLVQYYATKVKIGTPESELQHVRIRIDNLQQRIDAARDRLQFRLQQRFLRAAVNAVQGEEDVSEDG